MAIITFLMRVEFIIWFAFDMILSQANSVHKFLDEVGDNWEDSVSTIDYLIPPGLEFGSWKFAIFWRSSVITFFSSLLKIVHGTGG